MLWAGNISARHACAQAASRLVSSLTELTIMSNPSIRCEGRLSAQTGTYLRFNILQELTYRAIVPQAENAATAHASIGNQQCSWRACKALA